MEISYILDKLYLGCRDDACAAEMLDLRDITHILTIDVKPLSVFETSRFTCKYVYALDMADSDLLSHFAECIAFIEEGRKAGGVLVHCLVGQSRSATIVLAYIMQKLGMSLDDALTVVMKHRPSIRPNPGFSEQLKLFEDMGCVVDNSDPAYRAYKLNILAQKIQKNETIDMQALPEGALQADPNSEGSRSDNDIVYKCKKCRRQLFKGSGIMPHAGGIGEAGFIRKLSKLSVADKKSEVEAEAAICNQSLFIEPVQWMSDIIHSLSGKLHCPKCRGKLGSFSWVGERCPCSEWVTPAFHIQRAKVDECKVRLVTPYAVERDLKPKVMSAPQSLPIVDAPVPNDQEHDSTLNEELPPLN